MEALMFETKVLKDGIIKIPEMKNWKDKKIKIFIIENSYTSEQAKKDFVNEPVIEYRKLRNKSKNSEKLTIDTAININTELTNDIS